MGAMGLITVPETSNEIKKDILYHSLTSMCYLNRNTASDEIYISKEHLITEVFIIIHHCCLNNRQSYTHAFPPIFLFEANDTIQPQIRVLWGL